MVPLRLKSWLRRAGTPGSSGKIGWVRSSARTCVFSSTQRTTAWSGGHMESPTSPVIAVDHLVEESSVRFADRPQRPIGGVPESDHVGASVVWWHSDDTSTLFLVSNGRMTTADAQVRGGHTHCNVSLPQ